MSLDKNQSLVRVALNCWGGAWTNQLENRTVVHSDGNVLSRLNN